MIPLCACALAAESAGPTETTRPGNHQTNLEALLTLRVWRFITLVLASLALTMESAHVLELPQKMQYGADLYTAVNGTLYRYFAIVGGAYQIGSLIAAGILVYLVRERRPTLKWTAAGALGLLLAFGAWLILVAPVNSVIGAATTSAPDSVPTLWIALRGRWEYGHAIGFVLQLAGFSALLISLPVETREHLPGNTPGDRLVASPGSRFAHLPDEAGLGRPARREPDLVGEPAHDRHGRG
jgi:hypothetical protein